MELERQFLRALYTLAANDAIPTLAFLLDLARAEQGDRPAISRLPDLQMDLTPPALHIID